LQAVSGHGRSEAGVGVRWHALMKMLLLLLLLLLLLQLRLTERHGIQITRHLLSECRATSATQAESQQLCLIHVSEVRLSGQAHRRGPQIALQMMSVHWGAPHMLLGTVAEPGTTDVVEPVLVGTAGQPALEPVWGYAHPRVRKLRGIVWRPIAQVRESGWELLPSALKHLCGERRRGIAELRLLQRKAGNAMPAELLVLQSASLSDHLFETLLLKALLLKALLLETLLLQPLKLHPVLLFQLPLP
jgi:hypothetical protein